MRLKYKGNCTRSVGAYMIVKREDFGLGEDVGLGERDQDFSFLTDSQGLSLNSAQIAIKSFRNFLECI